MKFKVKNGSYLHFLIGQSFMLVMNILFFGHIIFMILMAIKYGCGGQ